MTKAVSTQEADDDKEFMAALENMRMEAFDILDKPKTRAMQIIVDAAFRLSLVANGMVAFGVEFDAAKSTADRLIHRFSQLCADPISLAVKIKVDVDTVMKALRATNGKEHGIITEPAFAEYFPIWSPRRDKLFGFIGFNPLEEESKRRDHAAFRAFVGTVAAILATVKESEFDELTSGLRHDLFWKDVEHGLRAAVERKKPYSLVSGDIDFFKSINDTYGHATGDSVLRNVASTIAGCLRDGTIFGRLGGEEFGISGEFKAVEALQMAERARARIQQIRDPRPLTMSFGVVTWYPHWFMQSSNFGLEAARRISDDLLYLAKHEGRNRVKTAQIVEIENPKEDEK